VLFLTNKCFGPGSETFSKTVRPIFETYGKWQRAVIWALFYFVNRRDRDTVSNIKGEGKRVSEPERNDRV
jgi:hypothetical protein